MTPFYFGESNQPLYGAYHSPTGVNYSNVGVVMCYPVGHEYNRVHRLYYQVAQQLSRMGLHVLRFDYFGTGDSSGSFVETNYSRWCQDVQSAVEELQAISGVRKLSLVGCRLGANIAIDSSNIVSSKFQVEKVICWDPILDTKKYLDEMTSLNSQMLTDPLRFLKPRIVEVNDELMGFGYSAELRSNLGRRCIQSKHFSPKQLMVLASEDSAESVKEFMETSLFQSTTCSLNNLSIESAWCNVKSIESAIKVPGFAEIISKAVCDV
ncbi:MAG: hypothetical protein COA86_10165 [Kangiella sp.]|nr:MAG: hypothetical protein COA86_10165 [Kangiella sp.]